MFDATTNEFVSIKSPRSKEQFLEAVYGEADSTIEKYFMQYAIAAILHK